MGLNLKHYNHISKLKTTKGIANYLLKHGFRGDRGFARSCPITKCVWATNPDAIAVVVGPARLIVDVPGIRQFQGYHVQVIGKFIDEFDMGVYPDLVRDLH